MKPVKNSDITLTVDGNGVPFSSNRQGPSKRCFALKATNAVTFRCLRCFSPICSGLLYPDFLESSPEQIGEKHLKHLKVTAFVAFNAKHRLLGPCRFEENGHTVTINSKRYIAILDRFHGDLTQQLTKGAVETGLVHAGWR